MCVPHFFETQCSNKSLGTHINSYVSTLEKRPKLTLNILSDYSNICGKQTGAELLLVWLAQILAAKSTTY